MLAYEKLGPLGSGSVRREKELLAELQHRVRNALATTRMIARRSAETSESLEDYVAHLDGRLAALARVQSAAIRDPLAGIDLGMLVADEITSAGMGANPQAQAAGPAVALHPRAAEPVALALHELMTNTLKFGALSTSAGRLTISWGVEADDTGPRRLMFDWVETGVRLAADADRRTGFGTIVLTEMLRHNLDAQTTFSFGSTGLTCRIVVPLNARTTIAEETPPL